MDCGCQAVVASTGRMLAGCAGQQPTGSCTQHSGNLGPKLLVQGGYRDRGLTQQCCGRHCRMHRRRPQVVHPLGRPVPQVSQMARQAGRGQQPGKGELASSSL